MAKVKILNNQSNAFTLFELLIVIALITLIMAMALPIGVNFLQEQRIEEETISLAENLKNAQARAKSGREDSSWGIKFNEPEEGKYTLFKGDSFDDLERDTTRDEVFILSSGAELEISDGITEIVFEKITGRFIVK